MNNTKRKAHIFYILLLLKNYINKFEYNGISEYILNLLNTSIYILANISQVHANGVNEFLLNWENKDVYFLCDDGVERDYWGYYSTFLEIETTEEMLDKVIYKWESVCPLLNDTILIAEDVLKILRNDEIYPVDVLVTYENKIKEMLL